jgi:hypothetical protein
MPAKIEPRARTEIFSIARRVLLSMDRRAVIARHPSHSGVTVTVQKAIGWLELATTRH